MPVDRGGADGLTLMKATGTIGGWLGAISPPRERRALPPAGNLVLASARQIGRKKRLEPLLPGLAEGRWEEAVVTLLDSPRP